MASNKLIFCAKIKQALDIEVFPKTISRYLNCSEKLKFCKMMGKPLLSSENKLKRLNFAEKHFKWSEEWKNVIFSNEKKFNLNGPNDFHFYWYNLQKEELIFLKKRKMVNQ